jgi:hypothetical protein
LIEAFSSFEARTGFAAGVNSVTAGLNARKEFLVDLGVLNKVGLKQDGLTVTDSGVRIGGMALESINETLREAGAGDLTLVPTSTFRRTLGSTYPELCRTEMKLLNPAPIPRLLGDKALQYWQFTGERLPVPPWQPLDHYAGNGRADTGALRSEFIDDAPLVLKARNSTHGNGIWFYPEGVDAFADDWQYGTAPGEFLDAPAEYLLQYAVPHVHDKRIIAAGTVPVAGENRYGRPDTDKSNLTLVETAGRTKLESARELLAAGAVEPLRMDRLDPAVERAVVDLHRTLRTTAVTGGRDLHTWIGWDLLVVDPSDGRLEAVPDDVLAGLLDERYRTAGGCYLVFGEGNLSPGSIERYVNALAHGRPGLAWDSAANLLAYGTSVSRDEPFEPGIPDALDPETIAARYHLDNDSRQIHT